ncbi:MAG: protein BatD [Candidatus Marinimicrobia bacterium]|nr:protein BatD [Candidatus Neomarinimicrobiota bacterium]MBL7009803.1 protein BatD [Candidatus Neomarinimicrobiota bacterium]MBL7029793.1 protein BatD [Candidatus Neomarinimicrobiota bacterium]
MKKIVIRRSIQFIWLIGVLWSQVSVTASVDVDRISKNETLGFKIVAVNADATPNVNISPILQHFKIVSGPAQQTNIQWVNGAMTSSRSLSWTLLPKKDGKLNIPSLAVTIGKQTYRTNPIGIQVQKGAGRSQMAHLFIEAKPDKEQAFPGEQVTVTYRLFTRVNLSIENIEYPKSVGFWNEDLRVSQTVRFRDTQIQGVGYKVATLYKAAMFPTQTGRLTIAPMTVTCNVDKPRRNRSGGVFDDPFFNSMFRETQRQFIVSDSLIVEVASYPKTPPADFTGAVGQFEIESWVDTPNVKVNEAITYKVRVKGTGNPNQFNLSEISFPQNMEVFPPTISFKRDEFRDDLTGEQQMDYILIPRSAGNFRLNPVTLTYFNPEIEDFVTARSTPVQITVKPGDKSIIASTQFNREDVTMIGDDIRYIRKDTPKWRQKGQQSIPIWVWGTYVMAAALFIFPGIFTKMSDNRLSTADIRKSRGALKQALKELSKPKEDIFSHTALVIYRYFQSKLFLSSDNLDPLAIELSLKGRVPSDLMTEIVKVTQLCDAGRFGPHASESEDTLQSQVENILTKIDEALA